MSGLDSLSVSDGSTSDSSVDAATDALVGDASECGTTKGPFTSDAGPKCPWVLVKDGGSLQDINCDNGQQCCQFSENASVASTCSAAAIPCGAGVIVDWRCEESNDCPALVAPVCCLQGTVIAAPPPCAHYEGVSVTSASCASACSGPQLCGTAADCPSGLSCLPFVTKGVWQGFCSK